MSLLRPNFRSAAANYSNLSAITEDVLGSYYDTFVANFTESMVEPLVQVRVALLILFIWIVMSPLYGLEKVTLSNPLPARGIS